MILYNTFILILHSESVHLQNIIIILQIEYIENEVTGDGVLDQHIRTGNNRSRPTKKERRPRFDRKNRKFPNFWIPLNYSIV